MYNNKLQNWDYRVVKGNVGKKPVFLPYENSYLINIALNSPQGTEWQQITCLQNPMCAKGDFVVVKALVDSYGDLYLPASTELGCYLKILKKGR